MARIPALHTILEVVRVPALLTILEVVRVPALLTIREVVQVPATLHLGGGKYPRMQGKRNCSVHIGLKWDIYFQCDSSIRNDKSWQIWQVSAGLKIGLVL